MQLARMDFLRQNNERSQSQTARVYIKTKNVCRTSWIIMRTLHPFQYDVYSLSPKKLVNYFALKSLWEITLTEQ